ncbi:MAG: MerR family transcriptional regulator [Anaerolineales bacterium]
MIKTLPQFQPGDEKLLYNIGVVSRMTGISMATLRAWERRYGFPGSGRTEGGHRLYSENDIFQLRWVKQRIEEGMQTAQAIHALRLLDSQPPFPQPELKTQEHEIKKDIYEYYQNALLTALLQHDLTHADQIMNEALSNLSLEAFIPHVIVPLFYTLGIKWQNHEIGVDTEHLATNYIRQKFFTWMLSGPPPLVKKPVVLACAPNELHEGGLLILGSLLRRCRIPIAYLGQSVPLFDLKNFILDTLPNAVVVVAMTKETALEFANWPKVMPEILNSATIKMFYGGLAYINHPDLIAMTAGQYLGDNIMDSVDYIEKLILGNYREK